METNTNNLLTINQLLDKFDSITIDAMTTNPPLGRIRQNLIDYKRSQPNGGLIKEPNTQMILFLINSAIKNNNKRKVETAAFEYH